MDSMPAWSTQEVSVIVRLLSLKKGGGYKNAIMKPITLYTNLTINLNFKK